MYKNGLILFSSILILSLLLSACGGSQPGINTDPGITAAPPSGNTGTISTGKTVAAASVQVPTSGGTLTVSELGTPITGLELTIPANAYAGIKTFEISYAPIEKHSFGDSFNPLTPLISIDNGGEYADEIMAVKIPVTVPPDNFAMGFIYDEQTKTLSGLPTLAQDASSLTVGTRHFTDLIISMIPLAKLKKDVDSGFRPGIDDFQFTNYGSYVAKGGHCAGQSVAALWYYVTQPDGKDLTLYGRYDNNGIKPATPNFWQDDSNGYRFVSTVHDDINWQSFENKFWTDLAGVNDDLTWKLFAYSMQITGEPQEVGIYSKAGGGHDMICYRVKDGNLYIADPNYPGNTERSIEFKDGKFAPYNSGSNADEIAKGNGKAYETIEYCAKTTTVSWDKIAQRWAEFKAGTVGNGVFPAYQIVYKDTNGKYPELKDGYVSPDKLIAITLSTKTPDTGCYVFRDGVQLNWDANNNYELLPGINKLGIYIIGMVDEKDKDGNPIKVAKFIDFKYLKILFSGLSIDPPSLAAGELNKVYTFTAKIEKAPENTKFEWAIDGTVVPESTGNTFLTAFASEGDHTISVRLLDKTGQEIAVTNAVATINKVDYGPITIDPPSLIDGEVNKNYTFTASVAKPPDKTKFEWSVDGVVVPGENSSQITTAFKVEGNHELSARLLDTTNSELAATSVNISIKQVINLLPLLQKSTVFNSIIRVASQERVTWDYKTGELVRSWELGNWYLQVTNLKWSGTSFSGDFSDLRMQIQGNVSGTISSDGLTLVEATIVQEQLTTATHGDKSLSYKMSNVPLMWKENNGGRYPAVNTQMGTLQTFFKGPGIDSYLSIISFINNFDQGVHPEIIGLDWTDAQNSIVFAFAGS